MRLIQLVEFVENFTGYKTYPLEFPYNIDSEDVLVVDIINGTLNSSVTEMNVQIMTRSSHPSTAEELSNIIITKLHNETNILWQGEQIMLIQAKNPNPFFNGFDENNNYIYTADFRILTTV